MQRIIAHKAIKPNGCPLEIDFIKLILTKRTSQYRLKSKATALKKLEFLFEEIKDIFSIGVPSSQRNYFWKGLSQILQAGHYSDTHFKEKCIGDIGLLSDKNG